MTTKILIAFKKYTFILALVLFIIRCTSNHNEESKMLSKSDEVNIDSINSENGIFSERYFKCDGELHIWYGGIQYSRREVARGYVFGDCLADKNSYVVIWDIDHKLYPKGEEVPLEEQQRLFRDGNGLIKDNFITYIFRMPFKENLKELDLLVDDPYKFPCIVSVYASISGRNKFRKKGTYYVSEWDSMAKLQYNIVNGID